MNTAKAACRTVKVRVSASGHFPISVIAFCDILAEPDSPKGYYVLALHSRRDDCGGDICGSTHMGWFAVQKATGRVFEWDGVEEKVGRLVKVHP